MTDIIAKHMISVKVVFDEGKEFPLFEELKARLGSIGKSYERLDAGEEDGMKEFQFFTDDPLEVKKVIVPILLSKGIDFKLGVF